MVFWTIGLTWAPGPGAATRTRTAWRAAAPRAPRATATPGTGEKGGERGVTTCSMLLCQVQLQRLSSTTAAPRQRHLQRPERPLELRDRQPGQDPDQQQEGEEEDRRRSLLLWIIGKDSKFCEKQKEETEGAEQSQYWTGTFNI